MIKKYATTLFLFLTGLFLMSTHTMERAQAPREQLTLTEAEHPNANSNSNDSTSRTPIEQDIKNLETIIALEGTGFFTEKKPEEATKAEQNQTTLTEFTVTTKGSSTPYFDKTVEKLNKALDDLQPTAVSKETTDKAALTIKSFFDISKLIATGNFSPENAEKITKGMHDRLPLLNRVREKIQNKEKLSESELAFVNSPEGLILRLTEQSLELKATQQEKRKERIEQYEKFITEAAQSSRFKPATLARGTAIGGFFLLTNAQKFSEFLQGPHMAPLVASLAAAGIEIPNFNFEITPDVTVIPRFGNSIAGYEDSLSLELGALIKGTPVILTLYIANLNSATPISSKISKDAFQYYDPNNTIVRKYDFPTEKTQEEFSDKLPYNAYRWGFALKIDLPQGWIGQRYPSLKKFEDFGITSPTFIISNFPYFDPSYSMLIQPGVALFFNLDFKGPFSSLGEFTTKNKPYFTYSENRLIANFSLVPRDWRKSAVKLTWRIRTAIDFEELHKAGKIAKKPSLIRRIATDDVVFEIKPSEESFANPKNILGINTAFNAQAGIQVHLMTQNNPFYLRAGVTLTSAKLNGVPFGIALAFYGKLDGRVNNIFGIDGIDMANLGFQIDMDTVGLANIWKYGIPSPISGLGMRGTMLIQTTETPIILDGAGAVTFKDNPGPDWLFRAYASSIPLSNMLSAIAKSARITPPQNWHLPSITFNDVTLEVATRDLTIATKQYTRGFEASAGMTINKFSAGGKFIGQFPEVGPKRFIVSGFMDEIDSRFIKISGVARDDLSFGRETPGPFFYLNYSPQEKTEKSLEDILEEKKETKRREDLRREGENIITQGSVMDTLKQTGRVSSDVLKQGGSELVGAAGTLIGLPKRYYSAISDWELPIMMFTGHLVIKPWKYSVQTDFVLSDEEISAKFETKISNKYLTHFSFTVPPWVLRVTQFKLHIELAQDAVTQVREKMLGYFQQKEIKVRTKIDSIENKYNAIKIKLHERIAQSHGNESQHIIELRNKILRKEKELEEIQRKLDEHKEKCSISHLSTWGSCLKVPVRWLHSQYKELSQQKNELQIKLEQELHSLERSSAQTLADLNTQVVHAEKAFLKAQESFYNFLNTLLTFELKRIFLDIDGQTFVTAAQGPKVQIDYLWKGQTKRKEWSLNLAKLFANDDASEFEFSADEFANQLFTEDDLNSIFSEE